MPLPRLSRALPRLLRSVERYSWAPIGAAAALLALAAGPAAAANPVTGEAAPEYLPRLEIRRALGPIDIDGDLDDLGWRGAAVASRFAEHRPGDQVPPPVDTDVAVTYDDEFLYVAYVCHDDPAAVRASLSERDHIWDDDTVVTAIDTYGDQTFAYELGANPYGIQGDALWSAGGIEDDGYDAIYYSAGRRTSTGYQVEFAIPFASLRFPDTPEQVWRMDFWRNHPRQVTGEYSWAAYDRDEQCWPCQWGTVTGIRDVRPGLGLEILPAAVAHQYSRADSTTAMHDGRVDADFSVGVKAGLGSNLTAEGTFNPDFSQVETDAAQIDANTTFALRYPEKRPFFLEGSDLFGTYFGAVYTRSINNPDLAFKVTGRPGRGSLAYLAARDEDSPQIVPFAERNELVAAGRSWSNVLRARHALGEQTHLGLLVTDRRYDHGGMGSVAGVDGRFRLDRNHALAWQWLATRTVEPDRPDLTDGFAIDRFADGRHTAAFDGEDFWGHGLHASLQRSARTWNWTLSWQDRSPTFRADNGFETSNDQRLGSLTTDCLIRYDEGLIERIQPRVNAARKWDFSGQQKDEWVWLNLLVQLRRAQAYLQLQHMRSTELFGGAEFGGIRDHVLSVGATPSHFLDFAASASSGHRIARFQRVLGDQRTVSLDANLRPVSGVRLELDYDWIRSDDLATGERLFDDATFFARLNLQLDRELSCRLVIQHSAGRETWDLDPLLTYRLNPFSIFYIGSTRDYALFGEAAGAAPGEREWGLAERQYFLKLQYLFQM